jgi:DNA-binding IclR family transcriptional regulator
VAELPSTYILSCSGGWIGRRTKPHAVANGKVLLAYGAIPMPVHLERYTEHTITAADALDRELAAVRGNGYATAVAELEDGLVAVASPVFDAGGACVAALSVSGPSFRMPPGSWPSWAGSVLVHREHLFTEPKTVVYPAPGLTR